MKGSNKKYWVVISSALPGQNKNQVGLHVAQWIRLGEDGCGVNESCNSSEWASRKWEISSWEGMQRDGSINGTVFLQLRRVRMELSPAIGSLYSYP